MSTSPLLGQIKIMLKSASYAVFRRIKNLENAVQPPNKPPNKIYATDENGVAGWMEKEFIPPGIYINFREISGLEYPETEAWKDASQKTQLTYAEGFHILRQGGMLLDTSGNRFCPVLYIGQNDFSRKIWVYYEKNTAPAEGDRAAPGKCGLIFTDSLNSD